MPLPCRLVWPQLHCDTSGTTSSGHFEGDQQDDDGVKATSRKEHLKPVGVGGARVLSVDIWRPVVGCLGNTDF